MSKLRVHELARELGRQNREVIEFLKSKGVDVRSHMSMVDEPAVSEVKNRFRKDNNNRGKEHIAKLETPKTEEKVVTAKSEGDKTETPKKKKNIIRVFHAQNASDGGKTRKKPVKAEGERTGSPRNAEERNSDSSRTDGDRPRRNNNDRPGTATEDRTDRTVREDLRVKEDPREITARRTFRPGKKRGRWKTSGKTSGRGRSQGDNRQGGRFGQGRSRAMVRAVRAEDSRAMEIVREDVSDREDHREMETVREEDRRAMARVVWTETEVKDVTDASAAVRDVRDSARIQERMTIWHLHRN